MVLGNLLDPIFDPLLNLHPALAIFVVSFLITFLVTIVYKYTTDQKRMKQLKEELKEGQNKMREMSKTNPQKALDMQGDMMQKNLEYMKHSFKATLYTLIPVLIIFGWMSMNLAYYPIAPNQEFKVYAEFAEGHTGNATLLVMSEWLTNSEMKISPPDTVQIIGDASVSIVKTEGSDLDRATWKLKATEPGKYFITVLYNGEKYTHEVLISDAKKYSAPEKVISDSKLKKIINGNDKVYPFNIFGLKFTWFWAYLVISIALSLTIRKIMQVY